jgi:hypothetical protein
MRCVSARPAPGRPFLCLQVVSLAIGGNEIEASRGRMAVLIFHGALVDQTPAPIRSGSSASGENVREGPTATKSVSLRNTDVLVAPSLPTASQFVVPQAIGLVEHREIDDSVCAEMPEALTKLSPFAIARPIFLGRKKRIKP